MKNYVPWLSVNYDLLIRLEIIQLFEFQSIWFSKVQLSEL